MSRSPHGSVARSKRPIICLSSAIFGATSWRANSGRDACHVGNGVDTARFATLPDATDAELRARLNLPSDAPIILAIGGVEERKNTGALVPGLCGAARAASVVPGS